METAIELKGYLLFLLMAGLSFVVVLLALYAYAVIQVASFVFTVLSWGVGSG